MTNSCSGWPAEVEEVGSEELSGDSELRRQEEVEAHDQGHLLGAAFLRCGRLGQEQRGGEDLLDALRMRYALLRDYT